MRKRALLIASTFAGVITAVGITVAVAASGPAPAPTDTGAQLVVVSTSASTGTTAPSLAEAAPIVTTTTAPVEAGQVGGQAVPQQPVQPAAEPEPAPVTTTATVAPPPEAPPTTGNENRSEPTCLPVPVGC
jgi:hypothetical protein